MRVQVWLGRHIAADPESPAWQDLLTSHRSNSTSTADRDELGGPRLLRAHQRITLTTIIDLPHGNALCPKRICASRCKRSRRKQTVNGLYAGQQVLISHRSSMQAEYVLGLDIARQACSLRAWCNAVDLGHASNVTVRLLQNMLELCSAA